MIYETDNYHTYRNRKAVLPIQVNAEFPPHCDTSDNLNEPFDVTTLKMCSKACVVSKKKFSQMLSRIFHQHRHA